MNRGVVFRLVLIVLAALALGVGVLRDGRGRGAAGADDVSSEPVVGTRVPVGERWTLGSVASTHGVASGDVSSTGALVWARASKPARMFVDVATNPSFQGARRFPAGTASSATDYAVTFRLRRLRPATLYHYRVWFSEVSRPRARSRPEAGTFKTAPAPSRRSVVRFVFGGDVGSSNYCRHAEHGYPIFFYMGKKKPDFFVSLGDMIYADSGCPAAGPEGWRNLPGDFPKVDDASVDWTNRRRVQEVYFQHWRYTRADKQLADFLGKTPIYSVWDDHEVVNDFGARWTYWNTENAGRRGYKNLVEAGRQALFSYGVLRRRKGQPNRQYRSFTWGLDLKLLITDTRSYRSRNDQRDTAAAKKTMLGAAQLAWLKMSLASATATWKVIASSVSVAVPTGSVLLGRDAWADGETGNGFERELVDLLRFLDQRNVKNVVFITADLHFPQATRHSQDYDQDGDALVFHEFVAGPLNARTGAPYWLDRTTNPTSLYGEGNFFNFGFFQILPGAGGKAMLRAETVDAFGKARPSSVLLLKPS